MKAKPRLIRIADFDDWEPSDTAQQIVDQEENEYLPILDAQGNPIRRKSVKVPIGFHGKAK